MRISKKQITLIAICFLVVMGISLPLLYTEWKKYKLSTEILTQIQHGDDNAWVLYQSIDEVLLSDDEMTLKLRFKPREGAYAGSQWGSFKNTVLVRDQFGLFDGNLEFNYTTYHKSKTTDSKSIEIWGDLAYKGIPTKHKREFIVEDLHY